MRAISLELENFFSEMKKRAKGYAEIARIYRKVGIELNALGKEFKKEIESLKSEQEEFTIKDELRIWKERGYSSKKKEIEKRAAAAIKTALTEYRISLSKITTLLP
jgi:hypothetical protein